MKTIFEQRIEQLVRGSNPQSLKALRRGIEKESLRVTKEGCLAPTPHPKRLGSALTHPAITTDYSEALLEFITPAFTRIDDTLDHLKKTHIFTYQNIDDELLWVNSMPCIMGDDSTIPIAQYGTSNSGRMKTVYRNGLGYRYGRRMQTISGIHYNFSFPDEFWQVYQSIEQNTKSAQDFTSQSYFDLIRNFQRFSPLLIYFFGASPAVCASFLSGRSDHRLDKHSSKSTLYKPFATSLRMSDLGYQNDAQSGLNVSYNSLDDYSASLRRAMSTPYPPYEKIGLGAEPDLNQLSVNILQIENEYYGQIRPKRSTVGSERPTTALLKRGVEYIEMRCLDLNPFIDVGIDASEMRFLDVFALYCLLQVSPRFSENDTKEIAANNQTVVMSGRNPEVMLSFSGKKTSLKAWIGHIKADFLAAAEVLDQAQGDDLYRKAVHTQYQKLDHVELTPSAKILAILESNRVCFFDFAMDIALQRAREFRAMTLTASEQNEYVQMAKNSLLRQQLLEDKNDVSFGVYLKNYLHG